MIPEAYYMLIVVDLGICGSDVGLYILDVDPYLMPRSMIRSTSSLRGVSAISSLRSLW